MQHILFILLTFSCINASAQAIDRGAIAHDSTELVIATRYLNEKLGEEYVKKNLIYTGHYLAGLHMIAFEITPHQTNIDKNMILIFINGDTVEDKYNTKVSTADIELYNQDKDAPNIFYNKAYALRQAKKANLKKGIRDWEVEIDGVASKVNWVIKSYTKEHHTPMWSANGMRANINIRTGETSISSWRGVE